MVRRVRSTTWHVLAAIAATVFAAEPVLACAVCFGDPDSDMAKGAVAGVLFLAGVIGCVLTGIAAIAVAWMLKARRLAAQGVTNT